MFGEVIVFAILFALIVGYFGGFGLSVNKDTYIDSVFHAKMQELKQEQEKKNNFTNDKFYYIVDRVILYDEKTHQYYKQYKIKLTDEKEKPLPKQDFEKLVQDLFLTNEKLVTSSGTCTVYKDFGSFVSFNKYFGFDKENDVNGNGGIGTVARYHNVGVYSGESLDLLVKVVDLKNIESLYISSTTPKGFKVGTLNNKGTVGFFIESSKDDVIGTNYEATLNFSFVKAGTSIPINASFDVLFNDIDNTDNRLEQIIVPKNSYVMYKVSDNSYVYGVNNGVNDKFFDILKYVPVNYPFDIKEGEIKFGDFKSEDVNAMLKLFYKNKSTFNVTFSAIKKVPKSKSFGRAGFLISFGNDLLTGCSDFYQVPTVNAKFVDQKLFNNMLIYNGNLSSISDPINYFGQYNLVVFSGLKVDMNNFNLLYKIVNSLSGTTDFIGSVEIDNIANPFRDVVYQINVWKDIGVKGIMLKGFDKNEWLNYGKYEAGKYDTFIASLILYIKSLGLTVVGDSYLIEQSLTDKLDGVVIPYNYVQGNDIKLYTQELLSKLDHYEGDIMCYSTVGGKDIISIYNDISEGMDKYCSYRTIQSSFINPITYEN